MEESYGTAGFRFSATAPSPMDRCSGDRAAPIYLDRVAASAICREAGTVIERQAWAESLRNSGLEGHPSGAGLPATKHLRRGNWVGKPTWRKFFFAIDQTTLPAAVARLYCIPRLDDLTDTASGYLRCWGPAYAQGPGSGLGSLPPPGPAHRKSHKPIFANTI